MKPKAPRRAPPGTEGQASPRRRTGNLLRPTSKKVVGFFAVVVCAPLLVAVLQIRFPAAELADASRSGDEIEVTTVDIPDPHKVTPIGLLGSATRKNLASQQWQGTVEAAGVEGLGIEVPNLELVPASRGDYRFGVRSRRNQTITIVDMHVRLLKRAAPLSGSMFLGTEGGGPGPAENVSLSVVMDDAIPTFSSWTSQLGGHELPFFRTSHITLSSTETVIFGFVATTAHYYNEWDIDIDYLLGAQLHHTYVNSMGVVHGSRDDHPFALTALAPHVQDYAALYIPITAPDSGQSSATSMVHYEKVPPDQFCAATQTRSGADSICARSSPPSPPRSRPSD